MQAMGGEMDRGNLPSEPGDWRKAVSNNNQRDRVGKREKE